MPAFPPVLILTEDKTETIMKLELQRPLVFFDLETTGVDIATARIVQIAMHRMEPDGSSMEYEQLVNPGIPIPPGATQVHGIRDADVATAPRFADIAPRVMEILRNADLGGYNAIRYDVPVLADELKRAGYDLEVGKRRLVDAYKLYLLKEPHTLGAAYQKFCGRELVGAHSALADTLAARAVLLGQLEYYSDLPRTLEGLADICQADATPDLAGRLGYDADREIVFRFGKYKGQRVKTIFLTDGGYYDWIMRSDFPDSTKEVLTGLYRQLYPARRR